MVTRATVGGATGDFTYTYDTAGRKATESPTLSRQSYTATTDYDAAGQVSGYTYPNGDEVPGTRTRTRPRKGSLAR
jgi:hypothetical protein